MNSPAQPPAPTTVTDRPIYQGQILHDHTAWTQAVDTIVRLRTSLASSGTLGCRRCGRSLLIGPPTELGYLTFGATQRQKAERSAEGGRCKRCQLVVLGTDPCLDIPEVARTLQWEVVTGLMRHMQVDAPELLWPLWFGTYGDTTGALVDQDVEHLLGSLSLAAVPQAWGVVLSSFTLLSRAETRTYLERIPSAVWPPGSRGIWLLSLAQTCGAPKRDGELSADRMGRRGAFMGRPRSPLQHLHWDSASGTFQVSSEDAGRTLQSEGQPLATWVDSQLYWW